MSDNIESLIALCKEQCHRKVASVEALPKAGGDRRYYRFHLEGNWHPSSVIAVVADNAADARAFVNLSRVFATHGVNVPEIFACSPDYRFYIEQDLGSDSLFDMVRKDEDVDAGVKAALSQLVRMQTVPRQEWDAFAAYPPFSERQAMFDLNYFKYEYLRNSPAQYDEEALQDDFERLAADLNNVFSANLSFMMRDFQSRNVMVEKCDGGYKAWLIDYQGGRLGPAIYDAVSFLWQARAGFSPSQRNAWLEFYASEYKAATGVTVSSILADKDRFVLFRTLQVLGAYGFRGLVQKRSHFIESIPGALRNLAELLADGALDDYPELANVARQLVADPRFVCAEADGKLHVRVFSFSYKRGYPEDLSGNGGGFMFDCRGMANPGRYPEFRNLTGKDQPVIDFLKDRGEADAFVAKALEIVAPSVRRYLERDFSSLQVGFGCTGGQHRSVYCAEGMAAQLAALFPEAVVELIHREQQ